METTLTASQILSQAANLLEYEIKEWGQGQYFKHTDQGCSMCAHGAIAYCGDFFLKDQVDSKDGTFSVRSVPAAFKIDDTDLVYIRLAKKCNMPLEDYIRTYCNGEVGLAHYKAIKVGLSFKYNDDPTTTKEAVISKLRQAALI